MRILIADDDAVCRRALESLVQKWGYDAVVAKNGHSALGVLRGTDAPSMAILDVNMPGISGIDVCARIRQRPGSVSPYIILLTADNATNQVVNGLDAGANDYISKPFDPGELHARVEAGFRVIKSQRRLASRVEDLQRMEVELRNLSLTDDLTGLLNRRGFMSHGEQYLKHCRRSGMTALLLFADMDGLKEINDTFGHSEGSAAIAQVARILRYTFRESDLIARFGGDEFAVLATGARGEDTEWVRRRLTGNLARFNTQNATGYQLRLSIGILPIASSSPIRLDDWLARADRLMYEEKRKKKRKAHVTNSPVPVATAGEREGAVNSQ